MLLRLILVVNETKRSNKEKYPNGKKKSRPDSLKLLFSWQTCLNKVKKIMNSIEGVTVYIALM